MEQLIDLIKLIALTQVALILLMIIVIYLTKIKLFYNQKKETHFIAQTQTELTQLAETFDDSQITDLKKYRHKGAWLLPVIKNLDDKISGKAWLSLRQALLRHNILPMARRYVHASNWYKRFLACSAFQLAYETNDVDRIKLLIHDAVPLIAINAAKLALQKPLQELVTEIISCFTKNRRIQNALLLQAVKINRDALPFIATCLNEEKDPYARVLCYRMLSEQPQYPQAIDRLENDLCHPNVDLQLAAFDYYTRIAPAKALRLIQQKLNDTHWEIRARAASLAPIISDKALLDSLEKALSDPTWWVRINAAESLARWGNEGIHRLQRQAPEHDQFAFDVAGRVLAALKNQRNS